MLSPRHNDSATFHAYDRQRALDCADHYSAELDSAYKGQEWIADYIMGEDLTRYDVEASEEWVTACAHEDGLSLSADALSGALDFVRTFVAGRS